MTNLQNQQSQSDGFSIIGESLAKATELVGISRLALGATVLAAAAAISGCSPKDKSFFFGSFTELPAPPPEARMQLGVSTESKGSVFINYVVWDAKAKEFLRKDIHYTTSPIHPGSFAEAGGYKQKIHDGEVIYGDAIVNQEKGEILLSNGNRIDGKTGNIIDAEGAIIKAKN